MQTQTRETKKKYCFFTFQGTGLAVAHRLKEEGNEVLVGMVMNNKDTLLPSEKYKPEDPKVKKLRTSLYEGMLKIEDAVKVYEYMLKQNPDEWFVFSDLNDCFKFTEKLYKKGFRGLLATQEDRRLEVERDAAKKIVEEHYPDLKVAENHEFSTVEEGLAFLEENEDLWVLKPKGESGKVIVTKQNLTFNRGGIKDALTKYKKEYETGGFIFEKMIENVCELTPEIIFWNGEPIMTTLDIENKPIGAGNIGTQTGCSACLVIKTNLDDKINKMAFPQFVFDKAKSIKGMSVFDASLYLDEKGDLYFGEYCSQRMGWDSIFNEIAMSSSTTDFFESLMQGENPLIYDVGTSVRVFNILSDGRMREDGLHQWEEGNEDNLFFYDIYQDKEGEFRTRACTWDTVAITGYGDNIIDSVECMYENVNDYSFDAGTNRPKEDFLSTTYTSAIMNRYNRAIDMGLINNEKFTKADAEEIESDIMKDEMETSEEHGYTNLNNQVQEA